MAFPTTSVLDDFNRASLGSNWTLDPYGWGANSWSIVSNQLSRTTNGEPLGAWNVSTYGPDCEIYATVVTKPTTTNDYVALGLGMGTLGTVANEDGYAVELVVNSGGTDTVNICRVDSGTFTTLGASISQEVADGEKLGLERIGSTITAYLYTGGAWTTLGSRTDSTYTGAGYLMLGGQRTTTGSVVLDDFGGGTVTSPGELFPPMISGRGAA